jgi:lysine-specific demethylase/histidyl-hydroxylase NO66
MSGTEKRVPMNSLEQLLNPLTLDEFYCRYFECARVHIPRSSENAFLDYSDLDSLIRSTSETDPRRLRANKEGQVLVPPRNASPFGCYSWALEKYAEGATIIINYVEVLDLRCGSLAKSLGASLHARIRFTVFMTPAGAQAFTPHFDTLDVFVLQVQGSKNWYLADFALQLPTLRQGYLVRYGTDLPRARQILLRSCDVLYIPRGLVHWAQTSDEPSAHISMDINTVTIGDLMTTAVRNPLLLNKGDIFSAARSQRLVNAQPSSLDLHQLINALNVKSDLTSLCRRARADKSERSY